MRQQRARPSRRPKSASRHRKARASSSSSSSKHKRRLRVAAQWDDSPAQFPNYNSFVDPHCRVARTKAVKQTFVKAAGRTAPVRTPRSTHNHIHSTLPPQSHSHCCRHYFHLPTGAVAASSTACTASALHITPSPPHRCFAPHAGASSGGGEHVANCAPRQDHVTSISPALCRRLGGYITPGIRLHWCKPYSAASQSRISSMGRPGR